MTEQTKTLSQRLVHVAALMRPTGRGPLGAAAEECLDIAGQVEIVEAQAAIIRQRAVALLGSIICGGSGPIAPTFDHEDWETERYRGAWSVVDERAIEGLRSALSADAGKTLLDRLEKAETRVRELEAERAGKVDETA